MSERRLRECGGEARSTARCYAIYVSMLPYIGPYSSTGLSTTRSLLSSQANAAVEQQKTLRFRATHCERSAWWPFLAVDSTACRPVRRIRKPSIPHGQRDVRCWPTPVEAVPSRYRLLNVGLRTVGPSTLRGKSRPGAVIDPPQFLGQARLNSAAGMAPVDPIGTSGPMRHRVP
jgi:hypothetical protein